MVDGWLNRPRGTEPARTDVRAQGTRVQDPRGQKHGVIVLSRGEDGRRSVGHQQPGVSGPSSGAHMLRLHLVMIPPGTRGMPHFHADGETAIYVVSGEADVWHGPGLGKRSADPARGTGWPLHPAARLGLVSRRRNCARIAGMLAWCPAR